MHRPKRNIVPASVWRNPVHFLAFGLGSGAAPYAPGTFGTVAAIPLYLLLVLTLNWALYAIVIALLFLFGIWLCGQTERAIGKRDHSGIVWDEFVGYFVTMAFVPPAWPWMLAGFLLFRLFDVWKPFPIRRVERHFGGGFGIMVDDVLAGIYANLILQVVVVVGRPLGAG